MTYRPLPEEKVGMKLSAEAHQVLISGVSLIVEAGEP